MSETIHPHGHYHSPEAKKKQLNRISKAIGHLQHVKTMIENDDDCADVLIQLTAVNSALHNLGKEIINEHMTHCKKPSGQDSFLCFHAGQQAGTGEKDGETIDFTGKGKNIPPPGL